MRVLAVVIFVVLVCGCATSTIETAPAAPAPQQVVGDQGPVGVGLPATQSVPPDWVCTGLRLTYRVETATVAGLGKDWQPDPDGQWQAPDGSRWTPGEKRPNAAAGFLQFDVTANGPSVTAILGSYYNVPQIGASPQLSFQYPVIGLPGNAGGLWVNPSVLKNLKDVNAGSLKIMRMQYKIGELTRPSVWIQTSNSTGYKVYVYDEATGVLLHDANSQIGKASPVIGNDEVANTASTVLSDGVLVAHRVLTLPWIGQKWEAPPTALAYSGTTSAPTGGGRSATVRQDLRATSKATGQAWALYSTLLTTSRPLGMPPSTAPGLSLSGLGQFGGAWLPPSILATLRTGQQLDSDPVTGVTVKVGSVSSGQVIITASSASQTMNWGYDRQTGLMNLIGKQDHSGLISITTKLTLVQG